jgi:hypothetical protein
VVRLKTAMIAHVSPAPHQRVKPEHASTARARAISNRVKKIHPHALSSSTQPQFQRNPRPPKRRKRLQMKLEERAAWVLVTSASAPHHSATSANNNPNLSMKNHPFHAEFRVSTSTWAQWSRKLWVSFGGRVQTSNTYWGRSHATVGSDCEILRLMVLIGENLRVAAIRMGEGRKLYYIAFFGIILISKHL